MNANWDDTYSAREYIYGKKPNEYFKTELLKLKPGRILLPAEGEGRNALFALLSGWEVVAFDTSLVAKKKAQRLCKVHKFNLDYRILDIGSCIFEKEYFDAIALIFVHMHESERRIIHRRLMQFLAPGGTLILEGFAESQIYNSTGGPKDISLLYNPEELKVDFVEMNNLHSWQETIVLSEGKHHNGVSNVVRLLGTK